MMHAALSFVLVVRSAVLSVYGHILDVLPWNTEPAYGPFQLSRWGRFKFRIQQKTISLLPAWIEHYGGYAFLVKTSRGKAQLNWLVDRIPDRVVRVWQRFSIATMVALLVFHSLLVIGLLVGSLGALGVALSDLFTHGLPLELLQFEYGREAPTTDSLSAVEILRQVALFPFMLAIAGLFWLLVWHFFVLALLPGLAIHEFGHYAMARKADVEIESFGFLFMGPFLQGAFVEPNEDQLETAPAKDQFRILAAGIGNNILLAVVYGLIAVVLLTEPSNAFLAVLTANASAFVDQPIAIAFVFLSLIELFFALMNTMPFGEIDGGQFVEIAEEELQ